MTNLATNVRWTDKNPAIYLDIGCESYADGADLKVQFKVTVHPLTSGSFSDAINATFIISQDHGLPIMVMGTVKPSGTSTWSADKVYTTSVLTVAGRADERKPTAVSVQISGGSRSEIYSYIIPRNATPSTFTVASSPRQMGKQLAISITRASNYHQNTIEYTIGNQSGTIATETTQSTINWSIPASLVSTIPNATSGSCTITCKTYYINTYIGSTSQTITLSAPDATVPTVNSTSFDVGGTMVISLPRAAAEYTHRIQITAGDYTKTVTASGTQYTEKINNDYATHNPNVSTVPLSISVSTYNGSALIGTNTINNIVLNIPHSSEFAPAISTFTLSPVNPSGSASISGLYVQRVSSIGVNIHATSNYADIDSYMVRIGTKDTTIPESTTMPTTLPDKIEGSGTITVYGRATDSRGVFTQTSQQINVIPYSPPSVLPYTGESSIACFRSNSQGIADRNGTYLHIKAKRSYSKVTSGGQNKNSCRMYIRYKKVTGTSFTERTIIEASSPNDSIDTVLNNVVTDINAAYNIEICVEDSISDVVKSTFLVSGDVYTLHLGNGGKKAAFFKIAELDGTLEVAGDERIYGDLIVEDSVEADDVRVNGDLVISGIVDSDLEVNGRISTGSSVSAGIISSTGNMSTGGNHTVGGTLALTTGNVTGNVNASGSVSASSISSSGTISSTGNMSTGGNLTVTGNETVGGTLILTTGNVTGNVNVTGTIKSSSDTNVGRDLSVTRNETVGGNLSVTGNETVGGTLTLTTGNVTGNVNASGTVKSGSDTNVGRDLSVTRNETVGGNLSVTGNETIGGTLTLTTGNVTGNVNASGTVKSGSDTIVGRDLSITRNETVGGNLSVTGNETVGGTLNLTTGNVTGDMNVSGSVSAASLSSTGTISSTGNASVGGNLTINGLPTFNTAPTLSSTGITPSSSCSISEGGWAKLGKLVIIHIKIKLLRAVSDSSFVFDLGRNGFPLDGFLVKLGAAPVHYDDAILSAIVDAAGGVTLMVEKGSIATNGTVYISGMYISQY